MDMIANHRSGQKRRVFIVAACMALAFGWGLLGSAAPARADELPMVQGLDVPQAVTADVPADAAVPDATAPDAGNPGDDAATSVPQAPVAPEPSFEDSHANIYRLYNPNSGEHFYTSDLNEATSIAGVGWRWEGIGWLAPVSGVPVYRLYNPNSGDHHYTMDEHEQDELARLGWMREGVSWRSEEEAGVLISRLYNPNAQTGTHHYTADANEYATLPSIGWSAEGEAWRATRAQGMAIDPFWLVSPAWGSLERYWVQADGAIAAGRLIGPDEGTGYAAYATPSGAVVRGKWDNGAGYVYVADDEGRLASTEDGKTGWLVTAGYDGGSLQRYYYVADMHAMKSGAFSVDGVDYWGLAGQGYVVRNNAVNTPDGMFIADNDGALTRAQTEHDITLGRALMELQACTSESMSMEEKLYAAFVHIRDDFPEYNPRVPHMKRDGWETIYANDIFVGRGGNCLSCAAAFAFMARAIGYTDVYACNMGHAWAEVNGRVFDPEWARNNHEHSYYDQSYDIQTSQGYKAIFNQGHSWSRVAI